MGQLLSYFIKTNVSIVFFYVFYIMFFKNDTFFKLRRAYLLIAMFFSLIFSFVTIGSLVNLGDIFLYGRNVKAEALVMLGAPEIKLSVANKTMTTTSIVWPLWVFGLVWVMGILVFLGRFLVQLFSIVKIRLRSSIKLIEGVRVCDLPRQITPFSFFHWIFIHTNTHDEKELKQIIIHELTHSRQWHSFDILLIEVLIIFFWWNPFVWFLKREIAINLEHIADNYVLRSGFNIRDYQYHLLRLTYHETAAQIANKFNVSRLKKRIMMMNKTKTSSLKLCKYLLVFPLALSLIAANSAFAQKNDSAKQSVSQKQAKGNTLLSADLDRLPEFPGGYAAMMRFMSDNIEYPIEAQKKEIQGKVIVQFFVEDDGEIFNVNVLRGIDPLLDEEAVRVVGIMPKWIPAMKDGKTERCQFTLPVMFKLSSAENKTKRELKTAQVASVPMKDNLKTTDNEKVYEIVEKMPQFPGGQDSMFDFLLKNIKYPSEAIKQGVEGRVLVKFIVAKTGEISDVDIKRGVHPLLDAETIRVINLMPKWIPGEQRGKKVDVQFYLPIFFGLPKDNKDNKDSTSPML